MKPKSHRGRGNRNAAKPPEVKRVPLSLRVLPETRRILAGIAEGRSLGRAVDDVVNDQTKGLTGPWNSNVSAVFTGSKRQLPVCCQ